MLDKVFLGSRVASLDTGDTLTPISRVNLVVDSDHMYTAGDDTGRTIEKNVPWASQAMADSILANLRNIAYRPYSGLDGLLDPAAEVGDGITVGGVYSVIAQTDILFDRLCTADVSAPGGDEIEDEYPYKSRVRRQADRELARVYSTITKTSESITLLVSNQVKGLEGKLELTSTSLTAEINNTREGLSSKIEQTATSLSSQISNANEEISRIDQTATELSSQISNAQDAISKFQQTVDGFELSVSIGDEISTISLISGGAVISSQDIYFNGMVTFSDLSASGKNTIINGDYIKTGTLAADNLSITGEFLLLRWDWDDWHGEYRWISYGCLGCGWGFDGENHTYGPKLSGPNNNYIIATNKGVRMQDTYNGAIWVTGGNCFASSDLLIYSDQQTKTEIDHDLTQYQAFFRALKPCRFLRADNQADGFHTGFVAQEVASAMGTAKLESKDFSGLGTAKLEDGTEVQALRYSAFIALNTYMIQTLERRIDELERKLKLYEGNERTD